MSASPIIINQISGGTKKDTTHMHQFAHGEVKKEHRNQEEMHIEEPSDSLRYHRTKTYKTHSKKFDINDVYLESWEVSHYNTAQANRENQIKRKIITFQRDVSDMRYGDSS